MRLIQWSYPSMITWNTVPRQSFLSPPFAYAIFFLKAITKPEQGIDTAHIIRGVIPYMGLIVIALLLMVLFPEIITWLPARMIA